VNIEIRPAQDRDLPELTELYNHYIRTSPATFDLKPFSLEARGQWFAKFSDSGPYRIFVAASENRVIGYTSCGRYREKQAYETSVELSVYLAPDYGRRGLGTRLYETLFDALRSTDLHRAYAAITVPNDASIALHRKFEFKSIGRFHEVGRKFDRYWDVEWFEKELAPVNRTA
jgi:phosphinothricin acetyltransferase